MKPLQHNRHRKGFTLIEIILAVGIFSVVGVGLTQGVHISQTTHQSVSTESNSNRKIRDGIGLLRKELKSCRETSIVVSQERNGNDQLVFQVPVESIFGIGWGAYDRYLGSTSNEQNRVNWKICYVVQNNAQGIPCLLRQILDGGGALQREVQIVSNVLVNGHADAPGFTVSATGDVWEVTLKTLTGDGQSARTETFQVQTRN
ncbi:MAG: prepilin-type N-terminal cleavage/methylation domain-containing protein [bacterium]|nr:prepilin-type N-terminal cleavage/methylation domain-containing protein [bacterium]